MLLTLLLSACTIGQQPAAPTAAPAAPPAAPAAQATEIPGMGELAEQTDPEIKTTVDRIANSLDTFRGRTVTLSGEVNKIVSPHAFTIGGEGFGAEALIVSKQPLGELVEGQRETNAWVNGIAQVTGQVRPFDLSTYEKDLGVDLRDNLLQDWSGKPAIVLDTLALTIRQNQDGTGGATAGGAAGGFTVAEVVGNPGQYLGKTITVNGEVEEVYGTGAFKLDEEALLAGGVDNDLLVIAAQQSLSGIDDQILNDWVEVQGTLRTFVKAEIDRDYSWFDATPEVEATFEGKPVLIATSVSPSQETDNAAAQGSAASGVVSVADITGSPDQYTGKQVSVIADVQEMIGQHAFTLDESSLLTGGIDNDLLVIGAKQNLASIDDQILDNWVQAKGVVHSKFNLSDVQNEVGYTLDSNTFADWEGKPVLIASDVTVTEPTAGQPQATSAPAVQQP